MHTYANARQTQKGRLRLIFQCLNNHRSLVELAAEVSPPLRCAYKWLARYRSDGIHTKNILLQTQLLTP